MDDMVNSNILTKIETYKRDEIAAAKRALPRGELDECARRAPSPRGFLSAIEKKRASGSYALIAEIKRASPSRGLIRADFNPPSLARSYEAGAPPASQS